MLLFSNVQDLYSIRPIKVAQSLDLTRMNMCQNYASYFLHVIFFISQPAFISQVQCFGSSEIKQISISQIIVLILFYQQIRGTIPKPSIDGHYKNTNNTFYFVINSCNPIHLDYFSQLSSVYSCHISTILPFEIRNRSKPEIVMRLPVDGPPNSSPV